MAAAAFELLESLLVGSPWDHDRFRASIRERSGELSNEQLEQLRELLFADVFSEFDARYLSEYVRDSATPFSSPFRACEERWARDEELHYLGFRAVYAALFDLDELELHAELEERRLAVDFGPLADLFRDEFSTACLLAYDELATVRAYRLNFSSYALLGPHVMDFVRTVTADEGRHFRNFMKLLRQEHAHRLSEVDATIELIRSREGVPYGNTFVLDHDDGVWNDAIFDESADVLRRRLRA